MQGTDASKRDCFREISATFAEAQCTAPGQMGYTWSCGGGGGGGRTSWPTPSPSSGPGSPTDWASSGSQNGWSPTPSPAGSNTYDGSSSIDDLATACASDACAAYLTGVTGDAAMQLIKGASKCTGMARGTIGEHQSWNADSVTASWMTSGLIQALTLTLTLTPNS